MMQVVEQKRPSRQDTFDLRDQIVPDDHSHYAQDTTYPSDEEHSVLEDDSDGEEREEYMDDDDGSSSLSIPNESIDFDLVYALHSFAATVEGQANVVKGDSLFLMDDSNSYWWLVRVLKTQEVGYIPAENIETPFERLARLNKHRNVDLASATEAELKESKEFIVARNGSNQPTPSPTPGTARAGSRTRSRTRSVYFTPALSVHRYPPAVWGDEEEEDDDVEWDDEGYSDEDPDIADDKENERKFRLAQGTADLPPGMEPDDGMSWEDGAVETIQAKGAQPAGQSTVPPSGSDGSMEAQQEVIQRQRRMQEEQQRAAAGGVQIVPGQGSRERLNAITDGPISGSPTSVSSRSPSSPSKVMDPAEVVETRKVSITPAVARSDEDQPRSQANAGPRLPSAMMQAQERKRAREELEAEEAQRKKSNKSPSRPGDAGDQRQGGGKLRKERDRGDVTTDDEGSKDKKKKPSVFGVLFNRKKDKNKDKDRPLGGGSENGSMNSIASSDMRGSEESGRSSSQQHIVEATSPVTASARQQQQQAMQQVQAQKSAMDPRRVQQQQQQPQGAPPGGVGVQISQHASQLRQRDQQQQALYQQYLNRSPSSPPEAQPSYGLQSASAVMPASMSFSSNASNASGLAPTSRPRPGSLVLSPGTMDAQGVGLPDLSVVRVFAGDNLQSEATFKTVLLNASTTASDLVRQAIQRFRLPAGEDPADYLLTIKQVEGSSATLLPNERPLGVFESLVEAAMELPKVKRSSVGSISSVASNLSMHPAIKKLSMNDFTDDSAVKFYLNRKGGEYDRNILGEEGDDTILAESFGDDDSRSSIQYLSPVTTSGSSVTLERFSSPSYRFALQLVIHPEDLPDDMVFDPLTEAIVFKDTLRDRPSSSLTSPGISQTQRRKVFTFPKNATAAEVTEVGLERFGIIDGVVDGGDEVEDKMTKRRSSTRVRYGLSIDADGREKELAPTSKVVDAFPRPPVFRAAKINDNKRRSVDSAQLLLGSIDDIGPDDPVFILRRAITYRPSSRHRSSAPLDEIALQKLHRESMSGSSTMSDSTVGANDEPKRQKSTQEIIAAQRAARSANQRAVLSAQSNSARGLDVLLPGNAMIRSSRYEVDDRIRYSYVEPDGETFDISDIVEAEWRSEGGSGRERDSARDDLLQGVITKDKDRLGAKLDRVLSKIKHDKGAGRGAQSASGTINEDLGGSTSPSLYSTAEGMPSSRSATPNVTGRSTTPTSGMRTMSPVSHLSGYRTASPGESESRSRSSTATPSGSRQKGVRPHERQQSLASVVSDSSAYRSGTPGTPTNPKATKPRVMVPKDDFGVAQMMAVIEARGMIYDKPVSLPPLDPVDNLLFGREIDLNSLHPNIREIYSDTFKQLDEMDHTLDDLLHHVAHAF